jgi:hypothetical protein
MSNFLKTLRFPWKFSCFSPSLTEPLTPQLASEMSESTAGFITAYRTLLEALASNKASLLEEMLEPTLYQRVQLGLTEFQDQKAKLVTVNPEAPCEAEFFNEALYFNVSIKRNDSTLPPLNFGPLSWLSYQRIKGKNVIFFPKSITNANEVVLKLDVVFTSSSKLVLLDEAGEELESKSDSAVEKHSLRFETQTKTGQGLFEKFLRDYRAFHYAEGNREWIGEFDWYITDIDDCLGGNPYSKSPQVI